MPRDTNPRLTKDYAKGRKVAEMQYGNPDRALRDGYQYENSEKNHHKRGVPVRTDQRAVKLLETRRDNNVQRGNKTLKQR